MILYFGNILSKHGNNPTFIESLTPKLQEFVPLVSASDKKSQALRLFHMVFVFLKYRRACKLLLIDTYSTRNFWFAYILSRLASLYRIKYVPITRGGDLPRRLDNSPSLSRRLFFNAFRIISPSAYLQEEFQKRHYEVHYIPNFIPINQYAFKERTVFRPRLLWVRAYQKLYNPELALHVLKELKKIHPDAHLCMIGPDKDGTFHRIQQLVEADGLRENVTLYGKLTKGEWTTIAREYDIFINTTNFDNRPVSVIEAMALGLVVISTNVGGVSNLVDHKRDGILVNAGEVQPFVSAVNEVIGNSPQAKEMVRLAREKVEQFDWEIIKKSWLDLIDDALQ
jgi:glycosyltransferase involved in cell wall biosynthesis